MPRGAPSCLQGIGQGDKHMSGSLRKYAPGSLLRCVHESCTDTRHYHHRKLAIGVDCTTHLICQFTLDRRCLQQTSIILGMWSDAPSACIDVHTLNLYHAHRPFHFVCWRKLSPQHRGRCHLLPIAVCQDDVAHCSALSDDLIAALLYRLWAQCDGMSALCLLF